MPYPNPPVGYSTAFTNEAPTRLLPGFSAGQPTYQGGVVFDPSHPGLKIQFGPNSLWESIEELFDGRKGTPFRAGGEAYHRNYVRRFQIITRKTEETLGRAKFMGPAAMCSCPGVPLPFAPYIPLRPEEWDPNALAVQIDADQVDETDALKWIVTVTYSTEMPPGGPTFGKTGSPWQTGHQVSPWNLPPVLEYDTETYTDYPQFDLKGRAFLDAAGRPFNPPPGFLKGDRVLTLTRNERFYETAVEDYTFVVNATSFKGYQPGYALSLGSRAVETWLGATKFWRVTYKILLRKRRALPDGTFTPAFSPAKILNAGLYQKLFFGVLGTRLAPIIKFGVPVAAPALLNEFGQEQTATIVVEGQTYLKPTYMSFDAYPSAELNNLLNPGG